MVDLDIYYFNAIGGGGGGTFLAVTRADVDLSILQGGRGDFCCFADPIAPTQPDSIKWPLSKCTIEV